jgi:hypothetical protein
MCEKQSFCKHANSSLDQAFTSLQLHLQLLLLLLL